MLKPFFYYFGGKSSLSKYYPPPSHESLIEPFAGSAGYALRYPYKNVTLVERDPKVATTWKYLTHVSPSEILSLPTEIPKGKSVDDLPICEEAKLLIGWWLNRGTSHPCKTPSAWMKAGNRPNSFWGITIRQRIASQLEAIRHWNIIEGSYSDAPNPPEGATWFIDPPYQIAGKYYHYGSNQINYPDLAQWCLNRKGQIIVCENQGATWLPFKPLQQITSTQTGTSSVEVTYLRPDPDYLLDLLC